MSGCPYMARKKAEEEAAAAAAAAAATATASSPAASTAVAAPGTTSQPAPSRCPFSGGAQAEAKVETKAEPVVSKCPHMAAKASAAPVGLEESEARAVAAAERGDSATAAVLFKEHFSAAYNAMASTVPSEPGDKLKANVRVSNVLMRKLGYTKEQLEIIGDDVWKMQGTGNPHLHAHLVPGNTVVDLGSGFGIDVFLAAHSVGETGRCIGVDLSDREVIEALKRSAKRGLRNVDFRLGDIENLPISDNFADAVMSNGGFCLVPDKRKAFKEIFRVLKKGGRYSVSCTVRRKPLDPGTKWPSCFHVFMDLDLVNDIVTSAGLSSPEIDFSSSDVTLWDETKEEAVKEEEKKDASQDGVKVGIHRGDPAYAHLANYNMDEMFARVTIYGTKP